MSGHSHWSTIKHKKAQQDKQKAHLFSKAVSAILLAVKRGGSPDPEKNVYLRSAIEKAKSVNLPKENIQRILEKSFIKSQNIQEVLYEGFGPDGSTYVVSAATDNTNRSLSDIRIVFSKKGGKLGSQGSVLFQYNKIGKLELPKELDENEFFNMFDGINTLDFGVEQGKYWVFISYDDLSKALEKTKALGYDVAPEIIYYPKSLISLNNGGYKKAVELFSDLLNLDDVQNVYVNFKIKK